MRRRTVLALAVVPLFTAAVVMDGSPRRSREERDPAALRLAEQEPEPVDDPRPGPADWYDGEPGWSRGWHDGCGRPQGPTDRTNPPRGLTVTFEPNTRRVRPGRPVTGWLVYRNARSRPVTVDWTFAPYGTVLDAAGRPLGREYLTDVLFPLENRTLAAGETVRLMVRIATTTCGDGPDDPEPPLPAGTYDVVTGIGGVLAPPVPIALDPAAPPETVWEMPPLPVPRRPGTPCTTTLPPDEERRAVVVGVELSRRSYRVGETARGTVVLRSSPYIVGVRRDVSPVLVRDAVRSTGLTPPPAREVDMFTVEPEDETYRVPFSVPLVGCDGSPLPPGRYVLRAGLALQMLDGSATRFAPPVAVSVA